MQGASPLRAYRDLQVQIIIVVIHGLPLHQLFSGPGIVSETISVLPVQVFAFLKDLGIMEVNLGVHTVRHSIRKNTKSKDSSANSGKALVVSEEPWEISNCTFHWRTKEVRLNGEKQKQGFQFQSMY